MARTQSDQSLGDAGVTLEADGSAVSVGMATLQFKNWSLADGKVMLTAESIGNGVNAETTDTLQVVKLDADSLVLAQNGQVVWRFRAEKVSFSPD